MHNLLIRPTIQELEEFGEPDFVIYNAGDQRADRRIPGVTSTTSVMLNLDRREMVVLGWRMQPTLPVATTWRRWPR